MMLEALWVFLLIYASYALSIQKVDVDVTVQDSVANPGAPSFILDLLLNINRDASDITSVDAALVIEDSTFFYMGKRNLDDLTGVNQVAYSIVQQSVSPANVYRVQFRQGGTTSGCGVPNGCSSLPGPVLTQSELFNVTPSSVSSSDGVLGSTLGIPTSSSGSVSQLSRSSSVPHSSVTSQHGGIDTTPSSSATLSHGSTIVPKGSPTVSPPPMRSKSVGAIAGGVIGGLVCLAVAGGFIFCFFRRSRAARVEGHGYEIPRPAEENNGPEYLTGGTREDGPVNLEKKKRLRNMTDISIPSLSGANGSSFAESASVLPLSSDGRLPIPAPEAHRLAVVSRPVRAPPPRESTEPTAVEDDGDEQQLPEEIRRELRMLREEVRRFRTGGPTAEWLDSLPNDIPPPEYASSPDPEMRL